MPQNIAKKAAQVADLICQGGESYQRFQGKRLGVNRKVIAVKLGQKHRLLIADTDAGIVPWQCLSHESYNNIYMQISPN
ncbi:ParE family toxin-like protein [Vibrio parahaemolyticus]|uniref:ParE family toxin-like protein n=1 Tax=Vibrio parahaemolyticus TaxID=670 RepID=UPI003D81756A